MREGREYESTQAIEGEQIKILYRFDGEQSRTLRVHRSHQQSLAAAGFEVLFAASEGELVDVGHPGGFFLHHPQDYALTRRSAFNNWRDLHFIAARYESEPVHVTLATYLTDRDVSMGTSKNRSRCPNQTWLWFFDTPLRSCEPVRPMPSRYAHRAAARQCGAAPARPVEWRGWAVRYPGPRPGCAASEYGRCGEWPSRPFAH